MIAKPHARLAGTLDALSRCTPSTKEPTMTKPTQFAALAADQLVTVTGGAARVAAGSSTDANAQLQLMITQLGDSIKAIANNQNNSSNSMMPMMMMMMMMGGGGGGGGGAQVAAAPPPAQPQGTYVKVNLRG
jgi:hypothetical protein